MPTSTAFWICCCLLSVSMLGAAWWGYASWDESRKANSRLDEIARDQRGIRSQLSNVISMLLRAGFKRGRPVDWSDDNLKTRVMEEPDDSYWWRK